MQYSYVAFFLMIMIHAVFAKENPESRTIPATQGIHFLSLGRVAPRLASEIAASTWSIGGETLDRGFAVYKNYRVMGSVFGS